MQRSGITTIHDIEGEVSLRLFQEMRDEGSLGVRVNMILPRRMLPQLRTMGINNEENDLLRVGGIKIFADGTLGSQTAAMLESFEGSPGNFGILTIPENEMMDTVSNATTMGLTIAIHAIGDRAARVALNSIERAQQMQVEQGSPIDPTSNLRYRLEHVQLSFQTVNGIIYFVEYKHSPANPSWTTLTTLVGDGSVATVLEHQPLLPMRLYRVRQVCP